MGAWRYPVFGEKTDVGTCPQKRKKAQQIATAGRRTTGLPVVLRTASLRWSSSSSGFTMPGVARTRPSIPGALLDVPPPLTQRSGPRIAKVLDRDDSHTQLGNDEDGWLEMDELDERLSTAIRQISVAETIEQLQKKRAASVRECATLGRSWRAGSKTRVGIPASFYTVRGQKDDPRIGALGRYVESGGRVLGPLDAAFDARDTGTDEDDQRAIQGEGVGYQGRDFEELLALFTDDAPEDEVVEPSSNRLDGAPTDEQTITKKTARVGTNNLPVPPPILAASPRLGGSANFLWGPHSSGQRHAGSPTLRSPKSGRNKIRHAVMGSPTNSRVVSFHRDRCGISGCRSGRKRAGSVDVVAEP